MPPEVVVRELEDGSVEIAVSGLPVQEEEAAILMAAESHAGPVTLDLQDAEIAHIQTVEFLLGLADDLLAAGRSLRIVFRAWKGDQDRTERVLDKGGVLTHPGVVAVPSERG